jgi:cell division protein FtsZ
VVATGMDGASMAAIEPARPRAPSRAAPLIAPAMATAEPAEELTAAEAAWTMEAPAAEQPEATLFDIEPAIEEPAMTFEPQAEPVVARIVDPMVEDDEDEAPLVTERYEEAPRKSGWLSLFGGRQQQRYDAPAAPSAPAPQRAAAGGRGSAAPQMIEEVDADANDDLEIPSFLRRLAN